MNIDKIPAELHELVAKNILLSHGGIIYPMPDHLKMAVPGFDGTMHAACVESVLYSPGKWGGYHIFANGREFTLDQNEERIKIFRFILKNYNFPEQDKCLFPLRREELEDRVFTRERNIGFISLYGDLDQSDWDKIELFRKLLAERRAECCDTPEPLPGDIVEGAYYDGKCPFKNGVIESAKGFKKPLSVCAKPYVPFISLGSHDKINVSTSGGPFFGFSNEDLEYVGNGERLFCDWGHCGACANGAIDFKAKVNRWRVKDKVDY